MTRLFSYRPDIKPSVVLHKISPEPARNSLSNLMDKQTDRKADAGKSITAFLRRRQ